MGQCGLRDKFSTMSNSWGKEKSEETENPENGNSDLRNRPVTVPKEIDFRENFWGEYSAYWAPQTNSSHQKK